MGNTRYTFTEGAAAPLSVNLLYVTSSRYDKDWESLKHSHYFTELFYVKKGQGQLLVEHETLPLQKDDFVIVNPHTEHTETSQNDTPLEYVILGVEGIRFSFAHEKEYTVFNCKHNKEDLMFYFNAMLRELEQKNRNYELVCKNLLEILIISLLRLNDFQFDVVSSDREINRSCSLIKRYLDSNYARDITLDELAALAHLNKYYLVHEFTDSYGISPMNYLIEKRIQNSKELLSSTDYSIGEIARLSGFSSQSYFSQSFRRNCGISAGEYRKRIKQSVQIPPS